MRPGGKSEDDYDHPSALPLVTIKVPGRWLWYVDRDVFYCDPVGAEMLTGTQANAGLPLTSGDATAALRPGDRRYIMARLHETAAQEASFEADYRIERSGRAAIRVLWRGAAARDGRDGSSIVRGIVLDVSELDPVRDSDRLPDALDFMADQMLRARRISTETDDRLLVHLIDIVLMHLGRSMAARLTPTKSQDVH